MSTMIETPDTVVAWREMDRRERGNSFNWVVLWEDRVMDICRSGVPEAAALLDEHIPGWHERVTKPIDMSSAFDCVLGQVFDPSREEGDSRRLFGLLPPKKGATDLGGSGYVRGLAYFKRQGIIMRPFVFSSSRAVEFWGAEISRRSTT